MLQSILSQVRTKALFLCPKVSLNIAAVGILRHNKTLLICQTPLRAYPKAWDLLISFHSNRASGILRGMNNQSRWKSCIMISNPISATLGLISAAVDFDDFISFIMVDSKRVVDAIQDPNSSDWCFRFQACSLARFISKKNIRVDWIIDVDANPGSSGLCLAMLGMCFVFSLHSPVVGLVFSPIVSSSC